MSKAEEESFPETGCVFLWEKWQDSFGLGGGGAKHESTRSGIREETKNTDDSLNKERENCQRTSG